MGMEHWYLLGLSAAVTGLLLLISLSGDPQSRLYRWTRRAFWAAALLVLSGETGGVGLNLVNLAATAGLGLPGYIAVLALSML